MQQSDVPPTPTSEPVPATEQRKELSQVNRPKKPGLLIGIVAAVAVVAGVAAWLLFFGSSEVPKGPAMLVGKNSYLYACSAFDSAAVAKALNKPTDKNTQSTEETYAFAPANTKDTKVDLIKLTGEEFITSACDMELNRKPSTNSQGRAVITYLPVKTVLLQYPTEGDAAKEFDGMKPSTSSQALPSFEDTSNFVALPPDDKGIIKARAYVKHKNLLLQIEAPLPTRSTPRGQFAPTVAEIAKDAIKRIDDQRATKPVDVTNATSLGGHPLIDACHDANYAKITAAFEIDMQLEPDNVIASRTYGSTDGGNTPENIMSRCSFHFRTTEEETAQKDQKIPYASRFKHSLAVDMSTFENEAKAKSYVGANQTQAEQSKSTAQSALANIRIANVDLGDKAFKFETKIQLEEGSPIDTQVYYVAKGNYAFRLATGYARQSKPFKTTDHQTSDSEVKKIVDELVAATKRAEAESAKK